LRWPNISEFDPNPNGEALEKARQRWKGEKDTFGRVYSAILGISEYTRIDPIAEVASCSPNSAKKHLNRLVDIGVVNKKPETTAAWYKRNDCYFEWRDASRIAADLSTKQIIDRVGHLESEKSEYEERFNCENPAAVSMSGQSHHETTHERLKALSQWGSLDTTIQLYEIAYRLAINDGHLIDFNE